MARHSFSPRLLGKTLPCLKSYEKVPVIITQSGRKRDILALYRKVGYYAGFKKHRKKL